mgnify:CR=1 FL=1
MSWGRFEGAVRVELLDDGRTVRICEPFAYVRANGEAYEVPADFVCDGASIPRILWPLSGGPFEGKHRAAALVHDYLYRLFIGTRANADRVFYEGMRCCGVNVISARAKYTAVRLFGPRW